MANVDILRYQLELDSRKFRAGAKKADAQTKKLSNTIGQKLKGAVMAAAGAYLGYRGLKIAMDSTFRAAIKQQEIMHSLQSALEIVGDSWDTAEGKVNRFLRSMQDMTRYGDTDLAPTLQYITQLMGSLEKGMEGTRISADLAAAGLFDLKTAARYVAQAMEGEVTVLGRYIPKLKTSAGLITENMTATEKWTVAKKLFNKIVAGKAEKDLATFTGQLAQINNEMVDIGEALGRLVLDPFTEILIGAQVQKDLKSFNVLLTDMVDALMDLEATPWEKLAMGFSLLFGADPISKLRIFTGLLREAEKAAMEAALVFSMEVTAPRLTGKGAKLTQTEKDLAEIEELWFKSGQRTTEQMIAFYQEMRDSYMMTAKEIEVVDKKLHSLRMRQFEEYIQKVLSLLQGAKDIKMPVKIPVIIPEFIGPTQDFNELIQVSVFDKIELAIQEAAPTIMGAFDAIVANMDAFTASMLRAAQALATGDIYTAVNQFVSQWVKIFMDAAEFDRQANEAQQRALQRLGDEIERNIAALDRMTFAMREQREEAIRQRIAFLERALQARGGLAPGIIEQYEREIEGLRQELDRLFELMGDASALEGIQSLQDLMTFLSGMGDLDYQTAQQIARHFTRIFDLSIEEQIELWELIQGILIENGNITGEGLWAIEELLHDLYQQAEDQHEEIIEDIEDPDESQIMRSITMITEHQANLMVSILNSIYITLREFLDEFKNMAGSFNYGNITGGGGAIGPIYISGGMSGDAIAESINREYRARGVKVG